MQNGLIEIDLKKENSYIHITYKDNGKGIKKEFLKKIFDPFFTSKRGAGGSGLGLHIVYNIVVQKLKGTLECQSEENKGVLFLIKIPFE